MNIFLVRSRTAALHAPVASLASLAIGVSPPRMSLSIAQFLATVPALGRFSPTSRCRRTILEGTAFVFQRTALDAHSTRKVCGQPDHRLRTLDKQR